MSSKLALCREDVTHAAAAAPTGQVLFILHSRAFLIPSLLSLRLIGGEASDALPPFRPPFPVAARHKITLGRQRLSSYSFAAPPPFFLYLRAIYSLDFVCTQERCSVSPFPPVSAAASTVGMWAGVRREVISTNHQIEFQAIPWNTGSCFEIKEWLPFLFPDTRLSKTFSHIFLYRRRRSKE